MTPVFVRTDEERCIGAGRCVLSAPEIFDSGDDGIVAVLRQPDLSTVDGVREAELLCPARAITIVPGLPTR